MGRISLATWLERQRFETTNTDRRNLSLQHMGTQIPGASINMTEREENPGNSTDIKSNEKPIEWSSSAKDPSSEKVKILPTLVGYFAEDSASPAAFFKAIRKGS